MDNHNPYIKEERTTQWLKGKVQKDKQRCTQHTHKTKDRLTRIPLKSGPLICAIFSEPFYKLGLPDTTKGRPSNMMNKCFKKWQNKN